MKMSIDVKLGMNMEAKVNKQVFVAIDTVCTKHDASLCNLGAA